MAAPFPLVLLEEFITHPVDELWGVSAPPWAAALVLAMESWAVPPAADEAFADCVLATTRNARSCAPW